MKPILTAPALAIALVAAPAALLASPAAVAQTQAMTMTDAPLLSFSVNEEVRSRPDQAQIGAGVTTMGATAVEALRANSAAMAKLVAAIKARGVRDEDIQTSGISLSPQYDYTPTQNGGQPRFTGYQVSNNVRVTTRDIAKLGEMLDALIAAGGTNVDGPYFSMADPDALLAGARAAAMKKAEAKAMDYARIAGYRSVQLIMVSEDSGHASPVPMPVVQMMAADAATKSAPVEPGQVGNTLTLSVQYRMVR